MIEYQTDRPISSWTGSEADYWRQLWADPVPIFAGLTKAQLLEWVLFTYIGSGREITDYPVLRQLMRKRKAEVIAFLICCERTRMDSLNDRRAAVRATKLRRSPAASKRVDPPESE